MPRLAERKEDLPLLERHFIARSPRNTASEIQGLTHRAQIVLSLHSWPGNVRELENVIGHACMMAMGDTIDVAGSAAHTCTRSVGRRHGGGRVCAFAGSESGTLEEQERLLIIRALEAAGGNQSQAARASASAATRCGTS